MGIQFTVGLVQEIIFKVVDYNTAVDMNSVYQLKKGKQKRMEKWLKWLQFEMLKLRRIFTQKGTNIYSK